MRNLLLATDLSARSDRALERAVAIARQHEARLTMVYVVDEDLPMRLADSQRSAVITVMEEQLESLRRQDDPAMDLRTVLGRPHAGILEAAEHCSAELVILGVHREDAFKDMFRGTTVERVSRASRVPVLLVRDRATQAYQRVVIGIDFSVYSRRAIEFAVQFAPDAEFFGVHAYEVPFKGLLYGDDTRKAVGRQHQNDFRQMIDQEMAAFFSSFGASRPRLTPVLQEGSARQVIHQQVDRLNPDLLVVGTHGRTGVAHALLGSVAEDLLSRPPCDVLAVKAW